MKASVIGFLPIGLHFICLQSSQSSPISHPFLALKFYWHDMLLLHLQIYTFCCCCLVAFKSIFRRKWNLILKISISMFRETNILRRCKGVFLLFLSPNLSVGVNKPNINGSLTFNYFSLTLSPGRDKNNTYFADTYDTNNFSEFLKDHSCSFFRWEINIMWSCIKFFSLLFP